MLLRGKRYIGEIRSYSERDQVGIVATSTGELFGFSRFTNGFFHEDFFNKVKYVVFIPNLDQPVTEVPKVQEIVRILQ